MPAERAFPDTVSALRRRVCRLMIQLPASVSCQGLSRTASCGWRLRELAVGGEVAGVHQKPTTRGPKGIPDPSVQAMSFGRPDLSIANPLRCPTCSALDRDGTGQAPRARDVDVVVFRRTDRHPGELAVNLPVMVRRSAFSTSASIFWRWATKQPLVDPWGQTKTSSDPLSMAVPATRSVTSTTYVVPVFVISW